MTLPAEWLPLQALASPKLQAALAGAVEDWSQRWRPGEGVVLGSLRAAPRSADHPQGDPGLGRELLPGVVLGSGFPVQALVERALRKPAKAPLTALDRVVLAEVERRLVADLGETIGRALPAGRRAPVADPFEGGWIAAPLETPGGVRLGELQLAPGVLVPLRKQVCAAPRPRPPLPGALLQATADRPVRLELRLGRSELSLDAMLDLAVGDLVLLDTPVDGALDLVLGPSVAARAKMFAEDGRLSLQVQG